jgi:hypothetical protein
MLLAAWGVRWHRRNVEFDIAPHNRVQFEDLPLSDISPLDLRQDGEWSGDEAWVAAIDVGGERGSARKTGADDRT